jgi:hypothetical protein
MIFVNLRKVSQGTNPATLPLFVTSSPISLKIKISNSAYLNSAGAGVAQEGSTAVWAGQRSGPSFPVRDKIKWTMYMPAVGATQPPIRCTGQSFNEGIATDHLMARIRVSGSIPPLRMGLHGFCGGKFTLPYL